MQARRKIKPKVVVTVPQEYPWKYATLPVVNVRADKEEINGITLGSTR
jgi:hypothetical protein